LRLYHCPIWPKRGAKATCFGAKQVLGYTAKAFIYRVVITGSALNHGACFSIAEIDHPALS